MESRLYEWRRERNRKIPVWIHFKNNEPFAFAGLWDAWLDRNSGEVLNTFTIISTDANALLERIHDRMPVMYDREMGQQWLERNFGSSAVTLAAALRPPPSERMEAWDVSTLVNAPENDTPEMHRAVISRRSANRAVAAPIATLKAEPRLAVLTG